MAARLQLPVQPMRAVSVKIANGGVLPCSGLASGCVWTTQGHEFATDLRILALGSYDMMVGIDWLEDCGHMWIDWTEKRLQFTHQGQLIQLAGVQSELQEVQPISCAELAALEDSNSIAHIVSVYDVGPDVVVEHIPVEIEAVLRDFQPVFEEPTGLPPHRSWDHAIPIGPCFGRPP
ncbi:hypothetical protein D1007_34158 [Hordeum vulgare]|nr:hypothetical protein D1007_34158 [Hordeum vulgare]